MRKVFNFYNRKHISPKKVSVLELATILTVIEPIFYFLLITALSIARENYSMTKNYISELTGEGAPSKTRNNILTFVLLGSVIMLYSFVIQAEVRRHRLSSMVKALVLISGASIVLMAIVPADGEIITTKGKVHRALTFPPAVGLPLAMICHYFIFKNDLNWKIGWPKFSLLLSIAILLVDVMLWYRKPEKLVGLVQRLGLGLSLLWVFATSTKTYSLQLHRI